MGLGSIPLLHLLGMFLVLALPDLVVYRIIARLPHLGLEIQVDELILVRCPLAVRVAIVDNLAAAGVTHLDRRVRERPLGAPLEVVARVRRHGKGRRASPIAVVVEAVRNSVIEHGARGDGFV